MMNPYETSRLLGEYLLFHYGTAEETLPYADGPRAALEFPARVVRAGLEGAALPPGARALDLGCAVGRGAFELARSCAQVVGVDFSRQFIAAAEELRRAGELPYEMAEEGSRLRAAVARVPAGVERERVRFEAGDAMALREDLGTFDIVFAVNLIDRLREPRKCLQRLPELVRAGGRLVVVSPYTWLEEYTPREEWLGGRAEESTRAALERELAGAFRLGRVLELPFLLREHARKFQWSVAEGTVWSRQ